MRRFEAYSAETIDPQSGQVDATGLLEGDRRQRLSNTSPLARIGMPERPPPAKGEAIEVPGRKPRATPHAALAGRLGNVDIGFIDPRESNPVSTEPEADQVRARSPLRPAPRKRGDHSSCPR